MAGTSYMLLHAGPSPGHRGRDEIFEGCNDDGEDAEADRNPPALLLVQQSRWSLPGVLGLVTLSSLLSLSPLPSPLFPSPLLSSPPHRSHLPFRCTAEEFLELDPLVFPVREHSFLLNPQTPKELVNAAKKEKIKIRLKSSKNADDINDEWTFTAREADGASEDEIRRWFGEDSLFANEK
eukprot:599191-Hanusia_phi.AAC.2